MKYLPNQQYPPPRAGYWGPITSTINWCEEDYVLSPYIAEIVNSLTNLLFFYLGLKGIWNCMRYRHDRVFLISFIGYLLVGLGSFLFHGSLKYPMQLVDELSMIYTTCLMCYACFSFKKPRIISIILGLVLFGLAIFITLYYHYVQNPAFHQNAFAILATTVFSRSIYTMEITLRPSLQRSHTMDDNRKKSDVGEATKYAANARDENILARMWWMIFIGLSAFLGGFGIWTLDNKYCSILIQWRHNIGLPWGILLEGHGWWHLMTGIGAYFQLVWSIWLRYCLDGRQGEYDLNWPTTFSLPEIVYVQGLNSSVNNGLDGIIGDDRKKQN